MSVAPDTGEKDAPSVAPTSPDREAERIHTAYTRNVKAIELRPSLATGTALSRVTVTDGMTCEFVEGEHRLTVDMPVRSGGNDRGPNPGVFGRAALGSCLAMSYMRWAVEADLPVHRLEVEIQADYDARGELGIDDDVTPAYTQVRYVVTIETDAPVEEVRRVLDYADDRSPYLRVWADPVDLRRELRIRRPGNEGSG